MRDVRYFLLRIRNQNASDEGPIQEMAPQRNQESKIGARTISFEIQRLSRALWRGLKGGKLGCQDDVGCRVLVEG